MINYISKFYHRIKSQRFYKNLIKKNDLCFDIGANMGSKSKLYLTTGATVIAFEPQSACLPYLSRIKNPNFHFYPFAVGSENKESLLYTSNYSEVATLSTDFIAAYESEKVYWTNEEKVKVKSIDVLISAYGLPDYCKIDVEGYELEILSHLSYPIPIIEFEFTEKFISDTYKIIDLLSIHPYSFNYTLNEQSEFRLFQWVPAEEIKSIINALPKQKLHGNLFCKLDIK
jgi:FkbM family methyltransferase